MNAITLVKCAVMLSKTFQEIAAVIMDDEKNFKPAQAEPPVHKASTEPVTEIPETLELGHTHGLEGNHPERLTPVEDPRPSSEDCIAFIMTMVDDGWATAVEVRQMIANVDPGKTKLSSLNRDELFEVKQELTTLIKKRQEERRRTA